MKKNRIVVKVGTSSLTNEDGKTNLRAFDRLAYVLSECHNRGYEVILVSSGAIAIGINKLGLEKRPETLPMLQATAAIGQSRIVNLYDQFFDHYDNLIAQILFNSDDIEDAVKTENLTNTFNTLLENGIIPIVNENDSISYTEIESTEEKLFGDNDKLSAVVAILTKASKLIILSDIDGFYDKDPRLHTDAKLLGEINDVREVKSLAGGAGTRRGTGGMKTKLEAAELATRQGIETYVVNGKTPENVFSVLKGIPVGTKFTADQENLL